MFLCLLSRRLKHVTGRLLPMVALFFFLLLLLSGGASVEDSLVNFWLL